MKDQPLRCSVCRHPNLIEIQRAITSGSIPLSALAFQYGLSKPSLSRHAINHMGREPRSNGTSKDLSDSNRLPYKTPGVKGKTVSRSVSDGRCPTCLQSVESEDLTPESIIRRSEKLLSVAERIAIQAEANDDSRLALLAIDRAQKSLDSLAKIHGLIGADTVVNIDNRQQNLYLEKIPTDGLRALQVMHEAFDAGKTLAEALAAVEAQQKAPAALPRPSDTNEAVN